MLESVIMITFAILMAALVLAFVRLAQGPTLPDRVVAMELITAIVIGIIAATSVSAGLPDLLDVAAVMALMAFLAAIGFARYMEKGGLRDG